MVRKQINFMKKAVEAEALLIVEKELARFISDCIYNANVISSVRPTRSKKIVTPKDKTHSKVQHRRVTLKPPLKPKHKIVIRRRGPSQWDRQG